MNTTPLAEGVKYAGFEPGGPGRTSPTRTVPPGEPSVTHGSLPWTPSSAPKKTRPAADQKEPKLLAGIDEPPPGWRSPSITISPGTRRCATRLCALDPERAPGSVADTADAPVEPATSTAHRLAIPSWMQRRMGQAYHDVTWEGQQERSTRTTAGPCLDMRPRAGASLRRLDVHRPAGHRCTSQPF